MLLKNNKLNADWNQCWNSVIFIPLIWGGQTITRVGATWIGIRLSLQLSKNARIMIIIFFQFFFFHFYFLFNFSVMRTSSRSAWLTTSSIGRFVMTWIGAFTKMKRRVTLHGMRWGFNSDQCCCCWRWWHPWWGIILELRFGLKRKIQEWNVENWTKYLVFPWNHKQRR